MNPRIQNTYGFNYNSHKKVRDQLAAMARAANRRLRVLEKVPKEQATHRIKKDTSEKLRMRTPCVRLGPNYKPTYMRI